MWLCYGVHITVCMARLNVYFVGYSTFIEPSLHQLYFFLEIFYYYYYYYYYYGHLFPFFFDSYAIHTLLQHCSINSPAHAPVVTIILSLCVQQHANGV